MANIHLDARRHQSLFDPNTFNMPIHIIGVGATGSWLVLQLAKLGLDNITVWDFDIVEEHNIANQLYEKADIGKLKVDALATHVKNQTGLDLKVKYTRFEGQRLTGFVYLMIDTMAGRKEIWERSIKNKSAVKHLVEPRMGLDEARVYNVSPLDVTQQKGYEACWYPDDEAEVSACGTSVSVVTTALLTASICARQLINFHNEVPLHNEILVDAMYNAIYPTNWS